MPGTLRLNLFSEANFHSISQKFSIPKLPNKITDLGSSLKTTISTTASSLKDKTLNVINTTSSVARSKLGRVGIGMAFENAAEFVGYYAGIASALPVIELLGTVSRVAAQNFGKQISQTAVHSATIGLLFSQMETIRAALYRENLSTQKLAELASSLIVIAGMNYSIPSMAEEFSGDVGETAAIIASTQLAGIIGGYLSIKLEGFAASLVGIGANEEAFLSLDDPLESYIVKSLECAVVTSAMNTFYEPSEDSIVTQGARMMFDTALGSATYNLITVSRVVRALKTKQLFDSVLPKNLTQLISGVDTHKLFDEKLKPILKERIEGLLKDWILSLKDIKNSQDTILPHLIKAKDVAIEIVLDETIQDRATRKCIDKLIVQLEKISISEICEIIQSTLNVMDSNIYEQIFREVVNKIEEHTGSNILTASTKQFLKEISLQDIQNYVERLSNPESREEAAKELNDKLDVIVKKIWKDNIRSESIFSHPLIRTINDDMLDLIADKILQQISGKYLQETSDIKSIFANYVVKLAILNSSLKFEDLIIDLIPDAAWDNLREFESQKMAELVISLNERFNLHTHFTSILHSITETFLESQLIHIANTFEKNAEMATTFSKYSKVFFENNPQHKDQLVLLQHSLITKSEDLLKFQWKKQTLRSIIESLPENFAKNKKVAKFILNNLDDIWDASIKELKLSDEVLDNIADNLEKSLQAFEIDLIGIPISKEIQKEFIKKCLKAFLPSALNFMFLNTMNELRNPKPSNDPHNVYLGVAHFIFSYYSNAIPFGLDFMRDTIHEQIFNAKLLESVA